MSLTNRARGIGSLPSHPGGADCLRWVSLHNSGAGREVPET